MGPTEKRLCILKVVRQQEETQLNRGGRVKENKLAVYFWNCILTLLNLRRKGQTHLLKTWGVELSLVYDFYRHLIERVKSSVREKRLGKALRLQAHISLGLPSYRSQSHIIRKQFTMLHWDYSMLLLRRAHTREPRVFTFTPLLYRSKTSLWSQESHGALSASQNHAVSH